MVALISSDNKLMSLEEIQDYLICSLAHIGEDRLRVQNQDNLITLYVTENFVGASCEEGESESIANSLLTLGVKFPDIDRQLKSDDLRKAIYVKNLYVLNRNNVESILKNEYGFSTDDIKNKELTAVYSGDEQALVKYVDENISEVVTNIVVNNDEIHDDLAVSVDVLNNKNISVELKDQYINLMSELFESLDGIDELLWRSVILHNKVICNSDEIIRFFKKFGLSYELVSFINTGEDDIDYTTIDDGGALKKFFEMAVKNKDLDDKRYKEIAQQIGNPLVSFNILGLGDEKLTILIKENLIPMNLPNLQFIRQNYKNELCVFVEKDTNGYFDLIQRNNLIQGEILLLISDQKIDIESRKKLIDLMPVSISLDGKSYDDEIIIHILNKKFNTNDMSYLIENYGDFSNDVKEVLYKKISGQTTVIKNNISLIAAEKELLYRLFGDENVPASEKCNFLDLLISKNIKDNLQILLQKMGFSNMTKLVSGDTSRLPVIKNGAEENAILSVLKKHGYIWDFSANSEDETIRVERKKREI